jgi:PAS domain S-box-containing protein
MVLQKEITKKIKDLLKKNPQGLSITEIVGTINVNRNTAGRYLENLLVSGQVELRRFGMAKIYMLSQRVPLSAVLSISSELVIQLDHNLRIIFTNEPFLDLIGTEEKEILGKNIEYTTVTGVFDDAFAGFIQRIREGIAGKEWSGEIVLNTRNSILFCRIAPTVFEDGRKGVSVILEDITERRRGERALQESEATARALINAPTDSVILTDTRGVMLDLNDTAAFRLKKPKADLIGTLADTLLPENVAQSRRRLISRILETKQMVRFEDERDGTWFDTVAYPIIVSDGEVSRVAIIARDITDHKTAESKVRESEAKLRSIAENSPDMILLLNPDLEIVYANRLPTLNPGQILDKSIFCFIPGKFKEIAAASFRYVLETGKPSKFNIEYDDGYNFAQKGKVYFESMVGPVIQDEKTTALVIVARNITERKKANDALRESEDRYRTLVEISPDAVFLHREGTIIYANPAAIRLLGGSHAGEIIGREILDFISPEFRDIIRTNIQKDLNGEVSPRTELRMIRLDGRSIIVDGRGTTTLIDGIPTVQVAIREITEQKVAEEALQKSETMYRTLAESSADLIFVIGRDDRVEYVNSFAAKMVDRAADQVIGSPRTSLFPPEEARRQKKTLETIFETGTSVRNVRPLTLAGRIHWFDHYLTPLKNADNRVRSVLGISRDITERMQMEQELREKELTTRALLNAPTDSIILIDDTGIILEMNETAALRFGKRTDELVGTMSYNLLPEEVAQSRKLLMAPVLAKKEMVRFIDERDGKWYDTVAYPIVSENGDVKKIAIIARDITEQKNIERQLQISEQAYKQLLKKSFDSVDQFLR